jgi:hypothetical protein
MVAAQAVFAGQFLSGGESPVRFHELTGFAVVALGAMQILTALLFKSPRGAVAAFVMASALVFLAEGLQIGTGYGRFLLVHVPLAVLIFGGLTAQTVWVFR